MNRSSFAVFKTHTSPSKQTSIFNENNWKVSGPGNPWKLVPGPGSFASSTILLLFCNWLGTFYNEGIPFLLQWGHSFADLLQWGHSFDVNVLPSTTSLACVPEQIPWFSALKRPPLPLNKLGLNRIFVLPPSFLSSDPNIVEASFSSRPCCLSTAGQGIFLLSYSS